MINDDLGFSYSYENNRLTISLITVDEYRIYVEGCICDKYNLSKNNVLIFGQLNNKYSPKFWFNVIKFIWRNIHGR